MTSNLGLPPPRIQQILDKGRMVTEITRFVREIPLHIIYLHAKARQGLAKRYSYSKKAVLFLPEQFEGGHFMALKDVEYVILKYEGKAHGNNQV